MSSNPWNTEQRTENPCPALELPYVSPHGKIGSKFAVILGAGAGRGDRGASTPYGKLEPLNNSQV